MLSSLKRDWEAKYTSENSFVKTGGLKIAFLVGHKRLKCPSCAYAQFFGMRTWVVPPKVHN